MKPNQSQNLANFNSSLTTLKIITSLTFLLSVTGIILYFFFGDRGTMAYVDSVRLLNNYKGMEVARQEFDIKIKSWNANLDTLKHELEVKIDEYESRESKLTSSERKMMEELIDTKKDQVVNYQQIVSEKIKKEDQELTTKVYEKVNSYLKSYGEDHHYTIIFAATQYGNIVYAEKGVDITDKVLEGLNSEFAK